MDIDPLWEYMQKRQGILKLKEANFPKPWTSDPLLKQYSFTNCYREDDKTTKWMKAHVRNPYSFRDEVVLATLLFRWFNRIRTGEAIFLHVDLHAQTAFERMLESGNVWILKHAIRAYCGLGPYVGGAYMIKTVNGMNKIDGVLTSIENSYTGIGRILETPRSTHCREVYTILRTIPYLGPFMAAQLVADLKHTHILSAALDWYTFAAPGPGSRRGLNIVYGLDPEKYMSETEWCDKLLDIQQLITPRLLDAGWELMCAQDLQNNLCELSKYSRGYCKALYKG